LSVRMVLSLAVRGQGAAVDGGAAGGRNIGRRSGAKRTRQVARRRVRAVRGARKTQRNTGAGARGAAHRPRMQQRVGGDQHRHPVLRRRVALAAPGPAPRVSSAAAHEHLQTQASAVPRNADSEGCLPDGIPCVHLRAGAAPQCGAHQRAYASPSAHQPHLVRAT